MVCQYKMYLWKYREFNQIEKANRIKQYEVKKYSIDWRSQFVWICIY